MKILLFEKGIHYRKALNYQAFKDFIYKSNFDKSFLKNFQVDIKIHQLDKGDIPSRPLWHYDGTNKPYEDKITNYILYLDGDADSITEFFVRKPIISHFGNEVIIDRQAERMKNYYHTFRIKKKLPFYYNSTDLHRATPSLTKGVRLLIRLKEIK